MDDFKVRDYAGPFEVDGRWFCDKGNVRVDNSDNNVLEAYGTDGVEDCIVRRAFRGDKYVATYKFKWNGSTSPGWLVRWLSPGGYADETTLITSTAVDDVWSAGYVGLYRAASSSGAIQQYDGVKIGGDHTLDKAEPRQGPAGDGDILDAGDSGGTDSLNV